MIDGMLDRLSPLAVRAPRRIALACLAVVVLGVAAAGMLFSELDAHPDGSPGIESEPAGERRAALDPGGGEVVAVVDGAAVPQEVLDDLGATTGVEAVRTLPSDDGRATAVAVELAGGLGDAERDAVVAQIGDGLRAIEAPWVLVGGELLADDEDRLLADDEDESLADDGDELLTNDDAAELAERDAQRAECDRYRWPSWSSPSWSSRSWSWRSWLWPWSLAEWWQWLRNCHWESPSSTPWWWWW
jgi:hypothetical protein